MRLDGWDLMLKIQKLIILCLSMFMAKWFPYETQENALFGYT